MTNEIKNYLNNQDNNIYFLLCKFYYNPSNILNETFNLSNYKKKEINKLLTFINLCIKDEKFKKKLDTKILKQIHLLLFDIKEQLYKSRRNKKNTTNYNKTITNKLIKKVIKLEEDNCEKNILPK